MRGLGLFPPRSCRSRPAVQTYLEKKGDECMALSGMLLKTIFGMELRKYFGSGGQVSVGVRNACQGPGRVNGHFSPFRTLLRPAAKPPPSEIGCFFAQRFVGEEYHASKAATHRNRWLFRTTKETYRKPSPTAYRSVCMQRSRLIRPLRPLNKSATHRQQVLPWAPFLTTRRKALPLQQNKKNALNTKRSILQKPLGFPIRR